MIYSDEFMELKRLRCLNFHRVGRTARAGRRGLAISIFRFPRDLEFLSNIESTINLKLTEHPIDQRMVERIFMQVSVSKREQEMVLDNKDFDDRTHNYRRKKWIENGQDPDEMENKWKQEQKEKLKQRKKVQKEWQAKKRAESATNENGNLKEDERFKDIDREKFTRKKGKEKKLTDATAKPFIKNPLKINSKSKPILKSAKDRRKKKL